MEGWRSRKSHLRVSVRSRFFGSESFEATIDEFIRGESITLKKTETGEVCEPLDLRSADIRLASLPYPVDKAKGLEELEYGFVFNIMWEGDNETRCSLGEIRDFGMPV